MKVDPKHLSQLSMIVEAGSFQKAADRLGLTQPALSRNMQALESRLGTDLFRRDGRRSIPNKLGLHLARNGLAIRQAEEQALIAVGKSVQGTVGELRIGAPPIVAGRFLTDALSAFMRKHPACSVELRTGLVNELRAMLSRGQIDLVLGPKSLVDPNSELEFKPLINDRVGILCRVGHPLCSLKKITPADLETQSWLSHSPGSLLRQQTEAALIACGISSMHIALETDSIRTVLEMVSSTDLITTMPRETTKHYLERKLEFLSFDHPQFTRPLGAIKRSDAHANKAEEAFLVTLESQCKNLERTAGAQLS